jgi:hypothetical protein
LFKYVIRHPYTKALIEPQRLTVATMAFGVYTFKEYPESSDDEEDFLNQCGVSVHESDCFDTELEAYKEYVRTLKYELRHFMRTICEIVP